MCRGLGSEQPSVLFGTAVRSEFPYGVVSEPVLKGRKFFEDLAVGQTFTGGSTIVTAEDIKEFAKRFDAQPFHLDEEAAAQSVFGELVASGWHTASLTMKMLLEGEHLPAGGFIGLKADEMRWPNPTRAGDRLTCQIDVLELQQSPLRRAHGLVKIRTTTRNQRGQPVFVLVVKGIVERKSP